MNGWLWAATVLAGALVPLIVVAALRPAVHGLVALELAGLDAALTMLLFAEGTHSQSFATLALVLAAMAFAGSIGFIRFLAQLQHVRGGRRAGGDGRARRDGHASGDGRARRDGGASGDGRR